SDAVAGHAGRGAVRGARGRGGAHRTAPPWVTARCGRSRPGGTRAGGSAGRAVDRGRGRAAVGVAGPGPQPRPGPLRRRHPADHAGLGRAGRSRGGDGGLAVTPGVARGRRGADHRQPWLSTSHLTPAVCCTPTHCVLDPPPAGYGTVTSKGLGGALVSTGRPSVPRGWRGPR